MKISAKMPLLALALVTVAATMGGCNERTLFRDNDPVVRRRVEFYGSYDSETSRVARDRKRKQSEWGYGPNLFGSGGDY